VNDTGVGPYDFCHAGDGIEMVATPTVDSVRPAFARFVKGLYVLGSDREPLPHGTQCVVHGAGEGWARLVKGEPVRRIPRKPNEPFPSRKELGDLDQTQWPVFDGKPTDPWRLVDELLLTVRDTGRPVILSLSSPTGREAVADLCRLILYQRRSRGPTTKAVVSLGAGTVNFRFGPVAIPKFTIVDWIDADGEPEPLQSQNNVMEHIERRSAINTAARSAVKQTPRRKLAEPPSSNDDDLDDDIPFDL
jgi:hypothetical protein